VLTCWMIKLLLIHFYSFTEEERQACFVPPTLYATASILGWF
jgi:hypothetical protein